jgi:DNA modification methylase
MYHGRIEDAFNSPAFQAVKGGVDAIITSPPFPLVKKKRYGNETGENYIRWLEVLAPQMAELLSDSGSIVIEIGNAWEPGIPEMSTLPLEALLAFKRAAGLHLCQHVICHNTARLPSPAQWVTIDRIRLKDSFTHVWWLAKTPRPKADNRKVLTPYRKDMKKLLSSGKFNSGKRPSGHKISETAFLTDHGGAISANVLSIDDADHAPHSLLKLANTGWDANYRLYCDEHDLETHPARMQADLVAFFAEFLTDPHDLIVDPFAGSNTTGSVAEALGRRWMSVEAKLEYAEGSKGRFPGVATPNGEL